MSLISNNFIYGRSTYNANAGPQTVAIHKYSNLDDEFATIAASAYFNDILGNQASGTAYVTRPVQVGDIILVQASDQVDFLLITAISPDVTTEALITAGDIPDGSITAAKLASNSVTTAKIINNAVTTDKILNGQVTLAKLDVGILPVSMIVFRGTHVTTGGAATELIPIPGVLAGDLAICVLADNGTADVTLLYAATNAGNGIDLTFSANPGNDTSVTYIVTRDVS